MTALSVVMSGRLAGLVTAGGSAASATPGFEYDPEYLASPDATPLSVSVPLQPGHHEVGVWLDGLLSDNHLVRQRWQTEHHTPSTRAIDLLASAVGRDCAGAVQFCPTDQLDAMLARGGGLRELSERRVASMIATLRTDETAWSQGAADAAFSLAGAQAKTALRYEQGRWWQPYGDSPTTHILKPGIERFPDNEIIEHISQHAAALLGIDTAQTQCITVRGNHALLVTRYDRFTTPDGQYRRLHQEDSRGTSPRRDRSGGTSDRRDAATDALVAFRGPAACRGQATPGSLRVHPTHAPALPTRQDHARPRHRLLPANDLRARCQPPRHTKPMHPHRRAIRQEMPPAAGPRTASPLPKIVISPRHPEGIRECTRGARWVDLCATTRIGSRGAPRIHSNVGRGGLTYVLQRASSGNRATLRTSPPGPLWAGSFFITRPVYRVSRAALVSGRCGSPIPVSFSPCCRQPYWTPIMGFEGDPLSRLHDKRPTQSGTGHLGDRQTVSRVCAATGLLLSQVSGTSSRELAEIERYRSGGPPSSYGPHHHQLTASPYPQRHRSTRRLRGTRHSDRSLAR